MKKLILAFTIAAFASVASLQAGEAKDCAKACDKATAKATECTKTASAKAADCSACCSAKKANPIAKGATQLMAKR
jgi:hypothetical protein